MSTIEAVKSDRQLLESQDNNGQISYGSAIAYAESLGFKNQFIREYGIAGDWEDGTPSGVDVGELIVWADSLKQDKEWGELKPGELWD
jgi:hypothetical protein